MLQDKLALVKRDIISFATHVEAMLEKAINGLMRRDEGLLREIIEKDEPEANKREMDIDDEVTTMIAQQQPAAKVLRTLLMVLKMNNDLERIGDHAVNIAESNLFLIERPMVKPLLDIPQIAEVTIGMLKDGMNAFITEDTSATKAVCERDTVVDNLRDQIVRELITFMSSDPSTIERSLQLMRIATNFERIADLATNICEDVMYIVEGRIIKHHKEDAPPQA